MPEGTAITMAPTNKVQAVVALLLPLHLPQVQARGGVLRRLSLEFGCVGNAECLKRLKRWLVIQSTCSLLFFDPSRALIIRLKSGLSMQMSATSRSAGLAIKAIPVPAASSILMSLAPSPMAMTC